MDGGHRVHRFNVPSTGVILSLAIGLLLWAIH